jgi:fumarate reductase subunit C
MMEHGSRLIAGVGSPAVSARATGRRGSISSKALRGLVLALFMWVHMAFVSSDPPRQGRDVDGHQILRGLFFFGRSYPWIVSLAVASILALVVTACTAGHAQVPDQLRPVQSLPRAHADDAARRHHAVVLGRYSPASPCSSWLRCTSTSCLPGRTASVRSNPPIGSGASICGRCTSCCCSAVEVHGGIGLYRLAVKWGMVGQRRPERDCGAD